MAKSKVDTKVEEKKSEAVEESKMTTVKLDNITLEMVLRHFVNFYRATMGEEMTKKVLETYIKVVLDPELEKEEQKEEAEA